MFNDIFLEQPILARDSQDFYRQLKTYMDNKYPDGFDRVYTSLRATFMAMHEIKYEKQIFCVNEANLITISSPFRIDSIYNQHFTTSAPIRIKDYSITFLTVISYILNVLVEIVVLTNEHVVEVGLLRMHDMVYSGVDMHALNNSDELLDEI